MRLRSAGLATGGREEYHSQRALFHARQSERSVRTWTIAGSSTQGEAETRGTERGGFRLTNSGSLIRFHSAKFLGAAGKHDIWVSHRVPKASSPARAWPLAPTKPDVIKRLLDIKAELTLRSGPAVETKATSVSKLPSGPATVVGVTLSDLTTDDETLGTIATLTDLEFLGFGDRNTCTTAGLSKLASLAQLRGLDLYKLKIPSLGAADFLASLPRLEYIHLPYGRADEWAAAIASRPTIIEVDAYRSKMSDAGLAHLEKASQLKSLKLIDNSNVTQAAIDRFAAAV